MKIQQSKLFEREREREGDAGWFAILGSGKICLSSVKIIEKYCKTHCVTINKVDIGWRIKYPSERDLSKLVGLGRGTQRTEGLVAWG